MVYILLAGGLFLTIGDVIMKKWLIAQDWKYGVSGMLVWALGLGCLAATLKGHNIAVTSFMLVFFNIASLAFVEWIIFNNPLTAQQMAGLGLGLVALLLLQPAS